MPKKNLYEVRTHSVVEEIYEIAADTPEQAERIMLQGETDPMISDYQSRLVTSVEFVAKVDERDLETGEFWD